MPTVAELQIVLEAQDRASTQLRSLGQQVERLDRQVQGVSRGGGLLGGLNLGAGMRAFDAAIGGIGGVFRFVRESVVDLNSELERTTATFEAMTGSAEAARDLLAIVREEAARGFDLSQMEQAGRTLINFAEGSRDQFRELLQLAEQLAVIDPAAGIESAAFAIREALSGDFTSLAERFEVSRVAIQRWRDQGLSNMEIVQRAIESVGGSASAVERLGRTFESRVTTLQNFGNELRRLVGAGLFDRLSDLLGRAVALITQYGDRLREVAAAVGAVLAGIAERVGAALSGPLRGLLEFFAPGLWDQLAAGMERVPEAMERTGQAAERAAPAVRDITRDLARAGVAAAELQLEADRVRRRYDEQLEPLERQLRLLQQSADLQRVQNALATNRATVEGIVLERQIAALQRAARGMTDPNAPGLTLRQRMIALALQEAELRREELGLTEQQRPAVQSLQAQIAGLQEAQRRELEPLEAKLALQRDTIAALQLERQQRELATQDAVTGVQRVRAEWTKVNDPQALADAKARGEELADRWLTGWREWVDQNGGSVWTALAKSLENWWNQTGRPLAIRIGAELGAAVGAAAGIAMRLVLGPELQRLQALQDWVNGLQQQVQGLTRPTAGGPHDPFGPLGIPGPVPTIASQGSPWPTPAQVTNVNIAPNGIHVEGAGGDLQTAMDETIRQVTAAFARAEAQTDPGASGRLQGSGRTP